MRKILGCIGGGAVLATHHVLAQKYIAGFGTWLLTFILALALANLVFFAVLQFNEPPSKQE